MGFGGEFCWCLSGGGGGGAVCWGKGGECGGDLVGKYSRKQGASSIEEKRC